MNALLNTNADLIKQIHTNQSVNKPESLAQNALLLIQQLKQNLIQVLVEYSTY